MSTEIQREAVELNNLLYTLHTIPITDCIGLSNIAKETANDPALQILQGYIEEGKQWITKNAPPYIQKFRHFLAEITLTGNGILLKGEKKYPS